MGRDRGKSLLPDKILLPFQNDGKVIRIETHCKMVQGIASTAALLAASIALVSGSELQAGGLRSRALSGTFAATVSKSMCIPPSKGDAIYSKCDECFTEPAKNSYFGGATKAQGAYGVYTTADGQAHCGINSQFSLKGKSTADLPIPSGFTIFGRSQKGTWTAFPVDANCTIQGQTASAEDMVHKGMGYGVNSDNCQGGTTLAHEPDYDYGHCPGKAPQVHTQPTISLISTGAKVDQVVTFDGNTCNFKVSGGATVDNSWGATLSTPLAANNIELIVKGSKGKDGQINYKTCHGAGYLADGNSACPSKEVSMWSINEFEHASCSYNCDNVAHGYPVSGSFAATLS